MNKDLLKRHIKNLISSMHTSGRDKTSSISISSLHATGYFK